MKSIGIDDDVYDQLLSTKHKREQVEKRVISYSDIIKYLIGKDNGK